MVPVDTPWRLEFLLQSIEEPSLVVEAETVWEAADRARELLGTRLDRPRERLLEELGRARTIFSPLERALEAREPTTLELQTNEAFQFLEDHADRLDTFWTGGGELIPRSPELTSADSSVSGLDRLGDPPHELGDLPDRLRPLFELLTADDDSSD